MATVVRGLVDEAVVCAIAVVVADNEVDKVVLDGVFVEFLTVGVEVNVIKHVTGSMAR